MLTLAPLPLNWAEETEIVLMWGEINHISDILGIVPKGLDAQLRTWQVLSREDRVGALSGDDHKRAVPPRAALSPDLEFSPPLQEIWGCGW